MSARRGPSGHGPGCRVYDPSAGHEAAVVSHLHVCVLPWRLLAGLPRELRFEVPIEMARAAVRIGWVANLADGPECLPGETVGERELRVASKVLAGQIGG